jgi:outer membrane receptor protein involved in Fe transport
VIFAFGVDNLFNEDDVRYLDLRSQGSNNLVPSPSPGITLQSSLKVRFGDAFFKRG